MKNYLYIFLIFTSAACMEKVQTPMIIEKVTDAKNIDRIYDPTISGHDLSMYNKPYDMRITPEFNDDSQILNSNILLMQNRDTIFNEVINLNILQNQILKEKYFFGKEGYEQISSDYNLERISYESVRTDDLYFNAHLKHKSKVKSMYIKFQLSYFPKNAGKLYVNGFYPTAQTENY